MALLVDTSVWSLAFRRNGRTQCAEVEALRTALVGGEDVMTTGMILLEVLRGVIPAKARTALIAAFDSLAFITPDRADYETAAERANTCRRGGVQLGSVDALLAQIAIRYELTILTTDRDFTHAEDHIPIRIWRPGNSS